MITAEELLAELAIASAPMEGHPVPLVFHAGAISLTIRPGRDHWHVPLLVTAEVLADPALLREKLRAGREVLELKLRKA